MAELSITHKAQMQTNLNRAFDLITALVDDPSLLGDIPDGSTIDLTRPIPLPHEHPVFVPGCFRCDLSAGEA